MTDQQITQEEYEQLLDDAAYLQDEAEALKYIIEAVPYTEIPEGGMSIIQKLMMIDHAQKSYYRPLIEKALSSNRPIKLDSFDHYKETFDDPDDEENVIKVLDKIIKHRAALLNLFSNISLIDWESEVLANSDKTMSVYDLAESLVKEERKLLKEIADLVLIYQNNKQAQREIDSKRDQRNLNGE